MTPYQTLAKELYADGIRCQFQTPGQMVVSRQEPGPIWPDRGNSFWLTYVGDIWHLFTWSPIGYRVPASTNIAALCRTCMAHGDSAMPEVPIEIMTTFGLIRLSKEEADQVLEQMPGDGDDGGQGQ